MSTGSDDIAAARARVANGLGNAVDEWRLRVDERRDEIVRKDMSTRLDSYFVHDEDAIRGVYEDTAEAIDRLGDAMTRQIRALEREVSELKGELRALRGHKLWTPDR
jgi:hypothetical protein